MIIMGLSFRGVCQATISPTLQGNRPKPQTKKRVSGKPAYKLEGSLYPLLFSCLGGNEGMGSGLGQGLLDRDSSTSGIHSFKKQKENTSMKGNRRRK